VIFKSPQTNIARAVRRIYEQRPYPNLHSSAAANPQWLLPPLPWINAVWQASHPLRRILVAGCGTGSEAFALQRRFPDAEIVGVDFSPRSIKTAKKLQKKNRRLRRIRFVVCDLSSSKFGKIAGDSFDFVSCHGVLSYIPRPERVLRNFARCLTTDGALYLGVNGEAHFSASWRQSLPGFGVRMTDFQDTRPVRKLLTLFDALSGNHPGWIAKSKSEYIAGDLFGPLIQNWPLMHWTKLCWAAGLHLLGSYSIFRALRPVFDHGLYRFLMPRSRADVVEVFETLRPSGFHRLIFSRQPDPQPPWGELDKLRTWRVIVTGLYGRQWPRRTPRWTKLSNLNLKSPATNTLIELRIPEWEIELLRRSDGKHSIGDILWSVLARIPRAFLRDQLYLLYQLAVINLLPPMRRGQ